MNRKRFFGDVVLPLLALLAVAAVAPSAWACKIPVFRYALERWHPDRYEVVVLHRGALSESDGQLVEKLREASQSVTRSANMTVVTVDLAAPPPATDQGRAEKSQTVFDRFADLTSPQILVHYPPFGPDRWQAWAGPLSAENVERLVDSRTRRQIVERLLAGDSAVWVLIESGQKEQDDQAYETLARELARLEKSLELPARELIEAEQEFQANTPIELRIGFSLLRLRRDDPEEQVFLSMLLHSEPDLADFHEPIAIPIFGRGRSVFALVGRGIKGENIEENCRFICGDCSCQVKEQNPGMDMLFAVNWDDRVQGSAIPGLVLPELTGVGGLELLEPSSAEQGSGPAAQPEVSQASGADGSSSPSAAAPPADPVAAADAATQATAEPDVLSPPAGPLAAAPMPQAAGDFGKSLLAWTLIALVLAALVVGASSLWMRSRHQL